MRCQKRKPDGEREGEGEGREPIALGGRAIARPVAFPAGGAPDPAPPAPGDRPTALSNTPSIPKKDKPWFPCPTFDRPSYLKKL